jgi:DHA2 family multidrug resistance protein-like MFS transporter
MTAVSLWITSFSFGAAIGPLLGGLVLQHFWWGSVFLISVPVMLLILIVGPFLLPEYRDPDAGRLDVGSAALSLAAVLGVIYGLKQIAQDGVTGRAVVSITAGAILGVLFVRRQQRLADPLIDLRLFGNPAFRASLVLYGGGILVLFGGYVYLPQYLQFVRGLSPLMAGLWTVPWAMGFVIGSPLTPALARRIRPNALMSCGMALSAVGFFLLAWIGTGHGGLILFALATFIVSLGSSPIFTLTNDIIIGSAPPERAGAASGISETCAELGGAMGIALFGSLGVALYRGLLADALPDGLSPEATQAAMSTLGGAVVVAEQLPAPVAAAVIDVAKDAFLRGLVVCAAISGIGAAALALFAGASFRRAGATPPKSA